jgi:hypothetical protein
MGSHSLQSLPGLLGTIATHAITMVAIPLQEGSRGTKRSGTPIKVYAYMMSVQQPRTVIAFDVQHCCASKGSVG